MTTSSMPASSMRCTSASSSSVLAATSTSPVSGSTMSSSATRPRMRSPSGWMTSPASSSLVTRMPSSVPQSNSAMTASCATSTRRRVRYPEFAVLSAVSARPLRAPCVELKYSRTVRPSLKFEMIGVEMISPEGLVISPRMPASCLICAGDRHHPYRVDRHAGLLFLDDLDHLLGDLLRAAGPGVDFLVVLLTLGDEPVLVLLFVLLDLLLHLGDEGVLRFRDDQIVLAERDAGLARLGEAERHQPVAEDDRLFLAAEAVDMVDQLADLLFGQQPIDQLEANQRAARQDLRQQHAARRRFDPSGDRLALTVDRLVARLDARVQRHRLRGERLLDLSDIGEHHALARLTGAFGGDVVETKHDVLRRHDDRLAVGRAEDVVGRHHQDAGFELRLQRQRHVHRHLVAVEIGVEGGADERMQLDRLALDQHRLKRLDAEAV